MQVSNSSLITDHAAVCALDWGSVHARDTVVFYCDPPEQGRYISVLYRMHHPFHNLFAICEAVVIGYKAIGGCSLDST